jgi:hypothetical protein
MKRAVEPGQMITFDDVELQPSRALDIVLQQRKVTRVLVDDLSMMTGRTTGQPIFTGAEAVHG